MNNATNKIDCNNAANEVDCQNNATNEADCQNNAINAEVDCSNKNEKEKFIWQSYM